MDNKKFGAIIAAMRKENKLTQKNLAEQLGVSEKAVSRWETGKGYPEISLLPLLAEILGVTPGELLSGDRNAAGYIPPAEEDALVTDMIEYADKITRYKASSVAFSLVSILFLIAVFTCLLVNYIINREFTWSLYPLGAMIMVWVALAPWFFLKKFRAAVSLTTGTAALVGYLFLIELICPFHGWVIPAALPLLAIILVPSVGFYFLFLHTKFNRYSLAAFAALFFGVVVNFAVNAVIQNYRGQSISRAAVTIPALILVAVSIILAVIGDMKRRREAETPREAGEGNA